MGLGRQAKVLTKQQQEAVLSFLRGTRHPQRNIVIFLLSVRAGLRAKEIASISWSMLTDAENRVSDVILLENSASKGKSGGAVWLNKELQLALINYRKSLGEARCSGKIVRSERGNDVTAQVVVNMMRDWYQKLGFDGCSSHSGRRTFITNAAKKISSVGGSIRDVQALARHSSLQMTQRYIECDVEAQKKVVQLL